MSRDTSINDRPIGSRRRDIGPPEPVGSPPPPRRRRGVAHRLASLLLLVAAALLIGALVWVALGYVGVGSNSGPKDGTPIKVVIPKGATSAQIAGILADKGVVDRETIFRARLKLNGDGAKFRSGTYTLKAGSSYDTIVRELEKAPAAAPTFKITVPEGQRLEETAALIDAMRAKRRADGASPLPIFTGAQYLAAARAQHVPARYQPPAGTTSIEGFLFPATFELRLNENASRLVSRQRTAFDDAFGQISMARAKKANLTPYDVVTIASLIEREAKLDKERPLVAAVIWNRLKVSEPLGIDASNQYAAYKAGSKEFWTANLTESELARDTPYNVRLNAGLPPTPIAAPGLKSLQAAAAPAKVNFRYYVAKGDGSGAHFFTADYNEFLSHQ